ncbi:syntaxin family protein [Striga asiatica]|uniref:Syntaxin family protein n=1 Tax=Striga asiatica TaxID=4170 RepID=A0A5A7R567_STRAF|nr:syntaxin family protein [Striga asiatica]
MLVANSFDLWQKDTFFSAAEEVQQSADIMESAYRTWVRARKEGLVPPQHLDELGRELQMALGTAKWQLEEFERAVRMSYRSHGDDITVNRHTQFVSAIEDQISNVESAFKESFNENGKKPFHWVNLDEQECDDLALFLSGTSGTPQMVSSEKTNTSSKVQVPNQEMRLSEIVPINEDASQEESRVDEVSFHGDRKASSRRTWNSPKKGTLEIVIDGDDREGNALIEGTSKEKVHNHSRMTSWINQRFGGGHRSQRQQLVLTVLPINSIRFVLGLMLTIFLVGKLKGHHTLADLSFHNKL